jgi:hypothetical protein
MDRAKLDEFLRKITQLESSGGIDTDHRRVTTGLHKGDTAMGSFGIMPKTADEFVNRRKMKGEFGPDEAIMKQMSPEQLKEFLAGNERVEANLARDIGEHVLKRSKGDEDKAAYMWNMGHNKKASSIDGEDLAESDYVRKFRRLKNLLSGKKTAIADGSDSSGGVMP